MASRLTRKEEELSCPVCHDIFKHPVGLSCGHSICKDCLQDWWKERPTKECPVCQRRYSKDFPPLNFVLKNLCENFLEEQGRSSSSVSSEVLCRAHGEKLKLFCLDDQQLVCLVCRDSEKHAGHKFLPVDEASGRCKQKVHESLKPLKEKLKAYNEAKTNYDITEKHIKVQARNTETQIKEQFEKLRRFLQEEEESRISAVRKEEAQKSQKIKEMIESLSREVETLSNAIQAAEDQLRADKHVSFLQNYKTTMEGVQQITLQDPPTLSGGALIDQAKHLKNLTFKVWDKMKDIVSYTPVVLDPNTASPFLMLSDDLTSVRHVKDKQQLPNNPERFNWRQCVLGSEGFNSQSGTHSWDVEVGDNTDWEVGVCNETYWRNAWSGHRLSIGFSKDQYTSYYTPERNAEGHTVSSKVKLRRIRVQLDMDKHKVSFSDLDSNRSLRTYYTTGATMYPFININDYDGPSLKMLPGKICVTLEEQS